MMKIISGTIIGLTALISSVSATGGYTLLDSVDVADYTGSAFVMIGLAFVVIVAVMIIKIIADR